MKRFNFGIIGTGRIAVKFHKVFEQGLVSGCDILAVASGDKTRAMEFAKARGISRWYGSYGELLEDPEIDIVYIAVTNELHFPCCEMAIRAGKHILCEKPLTTNSKDARALEAMAKEAGVFLMEGLWTRFLPAIQKAGEWVKDGKIGELRCVKAGLCAGRTAQEYPRLFDPAKGGGALLDFGIYCLHLARHFAGNRDLLDCKSVSLPGASGVDISSFILLEYSGGLVADISCSIGFCSPNTAYIIGTTGYIRIGPWFSAAEKTELFTGPFPGPGNYNAPEPTEEFSAAAGFEFEIEHVIDCIREGKTQSDIVPMADTIEAIGVIDRVRLN